MTAHAMGIYTIGTESDDTGVAKEIANDAEKVGKANIEETMRKSK